MVKKSTKLSGMYPILTTPFHDDESLDLASLKRLIDYLISEGIDGVVTLANASEAHLMNDEEKKKLAAEVIRCVDGRVPTIISITHFSSKIAAAKGNREIPVGYVTKARCGPAMFKPSMPVPLVKERYPIMLNTAKAAKNEVPASAKETMNALFVRSDFFGKKLA